MDSYDHLTVRILGSAAGGGLPQWNCSCANCRSARSPSGPVKPRTQSSLAFSPGGSTWNLINASPDLRQQIIDHLPVPEASTSRFDPVKNVLLTDAEVDHTAGLLFMREAEYIRITTTRPVFEHLRDGRGMIRTLDKFSNPKWTFLDPSETQPLSHNDPAELMPIPLPGDPPLDSPHGASPGDCIGLQLTNPGSGASLVYLPSLGSLDRRVMERIEAADVALIDGTFWTADELSGIRATERDAFDMGHVPVGGTNGSLERLSGLDTEIVYIHINNTNPMLDPDSYARARIEEAGFKVGRDGMEFSL